MSPHRNPRLHQVQVVARNPAPCPPVEPVNLHVKAPRILKRLDIRPGVEVDDAEPATGTQNPYGLPQCHLALIGIANVVQGQIADHEIEGAVWKRQLASVAVEHLDAGT